jgi:hypothetical protein
MNFNEQFDSSAADLRNLKPELQGLSFAKKERPRLSAVDVILIIGTILFFIFVANLFWQRATAPKYIIGGPIDQPAGRLAPTPAAPAPN